VADEYSLTGLGIHKKNGPRQSCVAVATKMIFWFCTTDRENVCESEIHTTIEAVLLEPSGSIHSDQWMEWGEYIPAHLTLQIIRAGGVWDPQLKFWNLPKSSFPVAVDHTLNMCNKIFHFFPEKRGSIANIPSPKNSVPYPSACLYRPRNFSTPGGQSTPTNPNPNSVLSSVYKKKKNDNWSGGGGWSNKNWNDDKGKNQPNQLANSPGGKGNKGDNDQPKKKKQKQERERVELDLNVNGFEEMALTYNRLCKDKWCKSNACMRLAIYGKEKSCQYRHSRRQLTLMHPVRRAYLQGVYKSKDDLLEALTKVHKEMGDEEKEAPSLEAIPDEAF